MSSWKDINEYVLLKIFNLLQTRDIENAGKVCRRWFWIARDELLWKGIVKNSFYSEAKAPGKTCQNVSPGTPSWMYEYRRLAQHVPQILVQEEYVHPGGVNDIQFSDDGSMFATCGQDARLLIWKVGSNNEKNSVIVEDDLAKRFGWSSASCVQFNPAGSLLMVSGTLKMIKMNMIEMGEIIVYQCKGRDTGEVRSRISLRPHDSLGCWYNNSYLISSNHQILANTISSNILMINKVNCRLDSDPCLATEKDLYKTYNCGGSYLRNLQVVPLPKMSSYKYENGLTSDHPDEMLASFLGLVEQRCLNLIEIPLHKDVPEIPSDMDSRKIYNTWNSEYIVDYHENPNVSKNEYNEELHPIEFDAQYHNDRKEDFYRKDDDDWLWENEELCIDDDDIQWEYFSSDQKQSKAETFFEKNNGKEILNEDDKLLIFTTGRKTWLPHQVGIKLMSKIPFSKKLVIPKDIIRWKRENLLEKFQERLDIATMPWHEFEKVAQMFDVVDVVFDLPGYISGYAVSPESRYLHVNIRPWAKGAVITDPYNPPPTALCVERIVIDLARMKVVGRSHPKQRIFIPSDNEFCEQTPIQVTRNFISTIMKDNGVIIDRHSGVHIASLPHPGVSKVAVNPHNCHMAVTVGEDGSLRQWRSKRKI